MHSDIHPSYIISVTYVCSGIDGRSASDSDEECGDAHLRIQLLQEKIEYMQKSLPVSPMHN